MKLNLKCMVLKEQVYMRHSVMNYSCIHVLCIYNISLIYFIEIEC